MWNVVQQLQLRQVQKQVVQDSAQGERDRLASRRRDEDLADQIDRLLLVTEAIWTLCRERLGLSDEQLMARIHALDASDGTIDGRHTRAPRRCAGCAAMVPAERETCQFCGAAVPGRDPLRGDPRPRLG
jgi:hypothetical protein